MKRVNYILILLTVIILGCGVYSIYQYKSYNLKLETVNRAYNLIKLQHDLHRVKGDTLLINEAFIEENQILFLLAIFPDKYCSTCMDMEIPWLKFIIQDYPESLLIVNSDHEYDLNKLLDREKIKYVNIEDVKNNLSIEFEKINVPIVILLDKNGIIHDVYVNNFKNKSITEKFYTRFISLMSFY